MEEKNCTINAVLIGEEFRMHESEKWFKATFILE